MLKCAPTALTFFLIDGCCETVLDDKSVGLYATKQILKLPQNFNLLQSSLAAFLSLNLFYSSPSSET